MKRALFLTTLAAAALTACNPLGAMSGSDGDSAFDRAAPIPVAPATLAAFTKLAAQGPDTVKVIAGPAYSIMAEGPAEAVGALRYKIENGEVSVGRKSGSYNAGPATITITAPLLTEVALAGSGDATVPLLKGDSTSIGIAGSGDLTVAAIETQSLNADIAGSGSVTASGATRSLDVSIAGAGSFVAPGVRTDRAEVNIAGSGDASFASDGEVQANLLGSGNVTVKGKAKCTVSKLGSGTLNCG